MRLNPDCIRDILLTVEELETPGDALSFYFDEAKNLILPNVDRLQNYGSGVVLYHLEQCKFSGFFIGANFLTEDQFFLQYLSPAGHEFLANIRSNTIWDEVKSAVGRVGSSSLTAIIQIAAQIISSKITTL